MDNKEDANMVCQYCGRDISTLITKDDGEYIICAPCETQEFIASSLLEIAEHLSKIRSRND